MKYLIITLLLVMSLSTFAFNNGVEIELSVAEQEYLKQLGSIKMGVDPDWYPLEYVDQKGNYNGIIPEILKLLEERLGITFELVKTQDWTETLARSRQGDFPLIPALNKTEYRDEWLYFTDPIMIEPNVAVTKNNFPPISDITKLKDKTLVTIPNTMVDEWARRDFHNLKIIYRDTELECLQAVDSGQADLTIRSQLMTAYLIRKEGFANLKINNQVPGYSNHIRMGVLKSEPILVDILNKGIRTITFHEKEAIINKFVSLNMETPLNYPLIITISSLVLLITLALYFWNRKLRKLNAVIKAGEEKQRAIIQAIPDGLSISDLNGMITYVSKESIQMWGYSSKNEIIGKNILNFVHPSHHEKAMNNIKLMMEGTLTGFAEYKMVRRSGRSFYSESNAEIIKDNEGNPYAILYVNRDISDKKRTELQLKKAIGRYEAIMNQSRTINWEIDADGLYTYISPNVKKILGYDKEEIAGKKHFYDLFPEEKREKLTEEVFSIIREQKTLSNYENLILHKDGQAIWFLTSGLPKVNEDGQVIGFQGSGTDITLRKNAELRVHYQNQFQQAIAHISANLIDVNLTNYQAKFQMMLEKLGEQLSADHTFILEFSENKDYLSYSYEWCASGIISSKDVLNQVNIKEFPFATQIIANREKFHVKDVENLEPGSPERKFFDNLNLKSGLYMPIIRNNNLFGYFGFDSTKWTLHLPDEDIELLQIVANIIGDIYIRNEIEAEKNRVQDSLREATIQAKQASQAKSEFLANMSHEIRTPLNGVIGFTDLLLSSNLNSEQQQYAHNTNVSGKALLAIINDILDFSKIEAGKLELDILFTDIHTIIQETTDILKYQAQKKNIKFTLDIDSQLPNAIKTDPTRLKQVLINLLNNAIKFTEKGHVKLKVDFTSIDENSGKINFSVIDTGIGIPLNHQEKLFSAFSQADSSITRKYGGTGLGLTISNLLLHKMGSKIDIESTPGQGSAFSFTITTEYQNYKVDSTSSKINQFNLIANLAHKGTQKILIAEDVEINLVLIKTIIKKIIPNALVSSVANGQEAVALCHQENFNLILMDVQMPVMDGLEATRIIRRHEESSDHYTPIIALTAGATKEETQKCIDAGINDFITKPIDQERLFSLLDFYLEKE
ncbi:PAS domain S-box protein [bacterium]|nr:PAS domain S-box protein [bacterium]